MLCKECTYCQQLEALQAAGSPQLTLQFPQAQIPLSYGALAGQGLSFMEAASH